MANLVLPADTLLSAMLPSSGGSLASGDTIDFNGHTLVVDCDAADYPFTPTNAGGVPCKLELRDLSRIKLNASLPTSICPWVDPANPLPAFSASTAIEGDNYRTALSFNARAEIQLNGGFGLGGGPAVFSTATRTGGFFGKVVSAEGNTLFFDRPINAHKNDILQNLSTYNSQPRELVESSDAANKSVTFQSAPRQTVGDWWGLIGGGVVIRCLQAVNVNIISSDAHGGTVVVYGDYPVSAASISDNASVCFDRFINSRGTTISGGGGAALGLNGKSSVGGIVTQKLFEGNRADDVCCITRIGSGVCGTPLYDNVIFSGELALNDFAVGEMGYNWNKPYAKKHARLVLKNVECSSTLLLPEIDGPTSSKRIVASTIGGVDISDTQFEASGTVSRVARTDFPTDTDLPDAFYFAPATASDVPWRYEDYWVRKGETLRISCRAMRGGDNGAARVAIGAMAVWVPAEGMPTLAEWALDSGEPLVWRGGQIAWTNNTGEDCQVRVWSMASGIHGAYIRVWQATGGAM